MYKLPSATFRQLMQTIWILFVPTSGHTDGRQASNEQN